MRYLFYILKVHEASKVSTTKIRRLCPKLQTRVDKVFSKEVVVFIKQSGQQTLLKIPSRNFSFLMVFPCLAFHF